MEKIKNVIIIIGTEPPCPRCSLLNSIVNGKVKELSIDAHVKHLAYNDEEAKAFAASIGLEPGTAKDVAKRLNQSINGDKLNAILKNEAIGESPEFAKYNDGSWSPGLDEFLRPFQIKASQVGILMTPVLIINGELMHQGSIPKMEDINKWMLKIKD